MNQKVGVDSIKILKILLAISGLSCLYSYSQEFNITVAGDGVTRLDRPIFYLLPNDVDPSKSWALYELVGNQENWLPSQLEGNKKKLWWILSGDNQSFTRKFVYKQGPNQIISHPTLDSNVKSVDIVWNNSKVLSYNYLKVPIPTQQAPWETSVERSGYIHPLFNPMGDTITGDMPADHVWHHGISFPWKKSFVDGENVDFWDSRVLRGRYEFKQFSELIEGPVYTGFKSIQEYIDTQINKVVIEEEWDVRMWNVGGPGDQGSWLWDITSTQTPKAKIEIHEYVYGGMIVSGTRNWAVGGQEEFLSSAGNITRNTKAKWHDVSGVLNGNWSGVTLMSHPNNYNYPEPTTIWTGIGFIGYVPVSQGEPTWVWPDNEAQVFKYRFYTHSGKTTSQINDEVWNGFGVPQSVTGSINSVQKFQKRPPVTFKKMDNHHFRVIGNGLFNSIIRVRSLNGNNINRERIVTESQMDFKISFPGVYLLEIQFQAGMKHRLKFIVID